MALLGINFNGVHQNETTMCPYTVQFLLNGVPSSVASSDPVTFDQTNGTIKLSGYTGTMTNITMKVTTTEGLTSESSPFNVSIYSCVGQVTMPSMSGSPFDVITSDVSLFIGQNVTTSTDVTLNDSRCSVTYRLETLTGVPYDNSCVEYSSGIKWKGVSCLKTDLRLVATTGAGTKTYANFSVSIGDCQPWLQTNTTY